jgi:c-di-GMP-binding flagellar brake protein YcgR
MPPIHRTIRDNRVDVGDKIEIIVTDEDSRTVYGSRIEEIKENELIASPPELLRGNCALEANACVTVRYNRPDAMYKVPATFDRLTDDRENRVVLKSPGPAERVQRRDYVRISKKVELQYSILKNRAAGFLFNSLDWIDSVTRDISAGGVSMRVDDDVDVGDILLVRINDYDQMGIPRFVASVCHRVAEYRRDRFAGMQFIDKNNLPNFFQSTEIENLPPLIRRFDDRVRNNMIRYVFDEQVKDRRRGVI